MVLWVSIGIDSSGKKQMIIANSPATIEYIVFLTLSRAAPSAVSKGRGGWGLIGPPQVWGGDIWPQYGWFFWRKNKGDGVCHTQNSQLRIPKREGGGGLKTETFLKKKHPHWGQVSHTTLATYVQCLFHYFLRRLMHWSVTPPQYDPLQCNGSELRPISANFRE